MDQEGKGDRRNAIRPIVIALIVFALAGVAFAATLLISHARDQANRAQLEESASVTAIPSEAASHLPAEAALPTETAISAETLETPTPTETPLAVEGWLADYAKPADRVIDFAALQAKNPDVYAWIAIPGTEIDHPIVYDEAGDWRYLFRDVEGKENPSGAIFTDVWNNADFSDPVTLVYGNNMEDGTMFASLERFKDARFFDAYKTIAVYREGYMLEYEIFAAYQTGNDHILASHDFSDPEVLMDYLEQIPSARDLNAHFRALPLSADDRILTLITDVPDNSAARYFVQGVLRTHGQ